MPKAPNIYILLKTVIILRNFILTNQNNRIQFHLIVKHFTFVIIFYTITKWIKGQKFLSFIITKKIINFHIGKHYIVLVLYFIVHIISVT